MLLCATLGSLFKRALFNLNYIQYQSTGYAKHSMAVIPKQEAARGVAFFVLMFDCIAQRQITISAIGNGTQTAGNP